jgi:hypothetical protein
MQQQGKEASTSADEGRQSGWARAAAAAAAEATDMQQDAAGIPVSYDSAADKSQ